MVREDILNRVCVKCGSNKTTLNKQGWAYWYKHEDGWYCNKCHCKHFTNRKWQKINTVRRKGKRLKFLGKLVELDHNPRTGFCSDCGEQGHTNMHHFDEYDRENPLKDTIELCVGCHSKRHWESGSFDARVARQRRF